MADTWNYTSHTLYRHTDGTTLSQAVKENMGDPVLDNLLLVSGTERKKERKKESSRTHNRKE